MLYNSRPLLSDFVGSLECGLAGLSWRLVAADNAAATAPPTSSAGSFPRSSSSRLDRTAVAEGINAAVAAAGGFDATLILNPDVRLADRIVAIMYDAFTRPA